MNQSFDISQSYRNPQTSLHYPKYKSYIQSVSKYSLLKQNQLFRNILKQLNAQIDTIIKSKKYKRQYSIIQQPNLTSKLYNLQQQSINNQQIIKRLQYEKHMQNKLIESLNTNPESELDQQIKQIQIQIQSLKKEIQQHKKITYSQANKIQIPNNTKDYRKQIFVDINLQQHKMKSLEQKCNQLLVASDQFSSFQHKVSPTLEKQIDKFNQKLLEKEKQQKVYNLEQEINKVQKKQTLLRSNIIKKQIQSDINKKEIEINTLEELIANYDFEINALQEKNQRLANLIQIPQNYKQRSSSFSGRYNQIYEDTFITSQISQEQEQQHDQMSSFQQNDSNQIAIDQEEQQNVDETKETSQKSDKKIEISGDNNQLNNQTNNNQEQDNQTYNDQQMVNQQQDDTINNSPQPKQQEQQQDMEINNDNDNKNDNDNDDDQQNQKKHFQVKELVTNYNQTDNPEKQEEEQFLTINQEENKSCQNDNQTQTIPDPNNIQSNDQLDKDDNSLQNQENQQEKLDNNDENIQTYINQNQDSPQKFNNDTQPNKLDQ